MIPIKRQYNYLFDNVRFQYIQVLVSFLFVRRVWFFFLDLIDLFLLLFVVSHFLFCARQTSSLYPDRAFLLCVLESPNLFFVLANSLISSIYFSVAYSHADACGSYLSQ